MSIWCVNHYQHLSGYRAVFLTTNGYETISRTIFQTTHVPVGGPRWKPGMAGGIKREQGRNQEFSFGGTSLVFRSPFCLAIARPFHVAEPGIQFFWGYFLRVPFPILYTLPLPFHVAEPVIQFGGGTFFVCHYPFCLAPSLPCIDLYMLLGLLKLAYLFVSL